MNSELNTQYAVRRKDLLHPELSFVINGVLFDVFKTLGGGHPEKYYQKAVAAGLRARGLDFVEQYYVPVTYSGQHIGKCYLDFLIAHKIVLELKRGRYLPINVVNQTSQYLKSLKLQLAIVALNYETNLLRSFAYSLAWFRDETFHR